MANVIIDENDVQGLSKLLQNALERRGVVFRPTRTRERQQEEKRIPFEYSECGPLSPLRFASTCGGGGCGYYTPSYGCGGHPSMC